MPKKPQTKIQKIYEIKMNYLLLSFVILFFVIACFFSYEAGKDSKKNFQSNHLTLSVEKQCLQLVKAFLPHQFVIFNEHLKRLTQAKKAS